MPVLWKYIASRHLGLTLSITCALIGLLVLLRPDEITRLAAISGNWRQLGIYCWGLLPYLLPIAIPIACLISSAILTAGLGSRGEWSALANAGLSSWQVLCPIVSLLCAIGALNAFITSEMIEGAHGIVESIKEDLVALKPLRALQPKETLRLSRVAVAAEKRERGDVSNIVFGYLKPSNSGAAPALGLICARKLRFRPDSFELENFAHVHFRTDPRGDLTNLIVEQTQRADVQASLLRAFLAPGRARPIPIDRQSLRSLIRQSQSSPGLTAEIRGDLMRRSASGILPIALGLIGLQAGLKAALMRKSIPLYTGALLATGLFLLFIAGRSLAANWGVGFAVYLGLPILTALCCIWRIHRVRLA